MKPGKKIRSLDGLRAISIGLVLLGHASRTDGFPQGIPAWLTDHAPLGVKVFFVISGFLITTLLLAEWGEKATINLKLFYIRRSLRIFPASYAFLLTVLACWALGVYSFAPSLFVNAATYTMNYVVAGTWMLGHLWSLSVEEQFYLVWPALILFLRPKRALQAAAAVAILSPLVLATLAFLHFASLDPLAMTFPLVADSIAIGCVLAGLLPEIEGRPWFQGVTRHPLGLMVPLLVLAVDAITKGHPRLIYPFGVWLMNLGIVYCIARFTTFSRDATGRFLNRWPMGLIGVLSYSLYLWQQLFLDPFTHRGWTRFPMNILLAFVAATISYRVVERPLLRLRRHFRSFP